MANISDTIEEFILSVIGDDDSLQLSRNELANYFAVAPSQINYVLATRFNVDKGYIIESKRGGGGFITLIRLCKKDDLLSEVLEEVEKLDGLTYQKASNIIDRLQRDDMIDDKQADIIRSAVSDKALNVPMNNNRLRKNVFSQILIGLIRG
ncbi:MAG: CtsR family transcriptional regulator [Christensenellales bacterium]